jgi:type IV secretory pathway VirD2 relaxase
MSERAILAVAYTPVSGACSAKRAVAGFLKYVQHRDQHAEPRPAVEGLLKYVAHRDRSGSNARLFNREGTVTDEHRRWLAAYVGRSVTGLEGQRWQKPGEAGTDRRRAAYRFVLSPELAKGLDLAQLTRAAMARLEADAGGIGPWLAAEHRNTAHPHVHIVLAARREVAPGRYRTVMLTRARLQRMKDAIGRDIERQRRLDLVRAGEPQALRAAPHIVVARSAQPHGTPRWRRLRSRQAFSSLRSRSFRHLRRNQLFGATLLRLRGAALSYHHQMERELEAELARREREGWLR